MGMTNGVRYNRYQLQLQHDTVRSREPEMTPGARQQFVILADWRDGASASNLQ